MTVQCMVWKMEPVVYGLELVKYGLEPVMCALEDGTSGVRMGLGSA